MEKTNTPKKKYRSGVIEVAVWENTHVDPKSKKEFTTLTANMSRSYKDEKGNWKKTDSYKSNDLPKLIILLQEAYKDIVIKDEALDDI